MTEKFLQEVDLRFTYLPLLVCCFITGLTDGTIYNGKHRMFRLEIFLTQSYLAYGTFVSMQTGK
jgi:hypothetical protein